MIKHSTRIINVFPNGARLPPFRGELFYFKHVWHRCDFKHVWNQKHLWFQNVLKSKTPPISKRFEIKNTSDFKTFWNRKHRNLRCFWFQTCLKSQRFQNVLKSKTHMISNMFEIKNTSDFKTFWNRNHIWFQTFLKSKTHMNAIFLNSILLLGPRMVPLPSPPALRC